MAELTERQQWFGVLHDAEPNWQIATGMDPEDLIELLTALYLAGYGPVDAIRLVNKVIQPGFRQKMIDVPAAIGKECGLIERLGHVINKSGPRR